MIEAKTIYENPYECEIPKITTDIEAAEFHTMIISYTALIIYSGEVVERFNAGCIYADRLPNILSLYMTKALCRLLTGPERKITEAHKDEIFKEDMAFDKPFDKLVDRWQCISDIGRYK